MSYISKNRLGGCQVSQPKTTYTGNIEVKSNEILSRLKLNPEIKETQIALMANWLQEHNHPVVPEKTSHPDNNPVSDIVMVIAIHGKDIMRTEANNKAISRLLKANPKPERFIIIEALEKGQTSDLTYLKKNSNVELITIQINDNNTYLFQKEALWTIGTRRAFEIEGITKVVTMDADCCFDDNSWAYVISNKLNQFPFVQPFIGVNYSDQKDISHKPANIILGEAYCLENNCSIAWPTPGGSFACTKEFFEKILNNYWPYHSVGAGDAVFWSFTKGMKAKSANPLANDDGQCQYIPMYYTEMILNHYYHGPMRNRMYATRNYIATKYNSPEAIKTDEQGLLAWTDTINGKILKECFVALKQRTNTYIAVNRQFTIKDTKVMAQSIAAKYYGHIQSNHPLVIATVYRYGFDKSPKMVDKLYQDLTKYCKNPFKFIVFTDTPIDSIVEQRPLNLHYTEAPNEWRRMGVFQKIFSPEDSVLYLDLETEITGEFTLLNCPEKHLYLAKHPNGKWDSAMMYFRNLPDIFLKYKMLLENKSCPRPEYIYFEPTNYLVALLNNKVTIKNIIIHADYKFKNEREPYPACDFILHKGIRS